MTSVLNGFNRIAPYYDSLTGLIFRKAILKSQLEFLKFIPPDSTVLILGGGTGAILPYLLDCNPTRRILYIEASSEMLKLAERNVPPEFTAQIEFVHGTHDSLPEGMMFDAIITNFFLDLFPDEEVGTICKMLVSRLRQHGLWLISDFVKGDKWWHGMMLWTMYRFFRFISGIKGSRLPFWEQHLETEGLQTTAFRSFFRGFIKSVLYTKSP